MEKSPGCYFHFTNWAKYTKTVKGNHKILGTLILYSRSSNYRKQKLWQFFYSKRIQKQDFGILLSNDYLVRTVQILSSCLFSEMVKMIWHLNV